MDYLDGLLAKAEQLHSLGYWLLMLVSFLESVVLVGGIVPGATLAVFAGALAAQGYYGVGKLICFAAVGAIFGDGLSYWLGTHGKAWFKGDNRYFKPCYLESGQEFFRRHGAKSILLGRFVGFLRMIVPFVAGLSGMRAGRFYFWNVLSAIAWSVAHIMGGYFLGQAWSVFAVWTSRGGIFLAALVVVFVCFNLLRRFAIRQGRWVVALLRSLWEAARQAIAANPSVAAFVKRHPRFIAFSEARFDKTHFSGLPLTLLSLAFLYVLFLFGGIVEDVLTFDRIVMLDTNLADLLHFYRDETLIQVFLWITLLGTARIIVVGAVFVTIWLWLGNRREFIVPFLVTIIGSSVFSGLGKMAFQRPRPVNLGVITETSYSFPSGHSVIAVAFFGFVVYCLWRWIASRSVRLNVLFAGIALILVIGFSRLYLGVHFLSDVLGGFLLGILWLIIGISLVERRVYGVASQEPPGMPFKAMAVSGAVACAGLLFYIYSGLHYNPPRFLPEKPPEFKEVGADIVGGFSRYLLPRFTESITGKRREPINILIVARDESALREAFGRAGWLPADPVSAGSVGKAAASLIWNESYPTAPIAPLFWNGQTSDYGFEKPTPRDTVRQRWQIRVWKTDMLTDSGMKVFAGMVCLDEGMRWGFIRKVDPHLDVAREAFRQDLAQSGVLAVFHKVAFVEPRPEEVHAKSWYFTDGFLDILSVEVSKSLGVVQETPLVK